MNRFLLVLATIFAAPALAGDPGADPRFNTYTLTDKGVGSVTNPPAGAHKYYDRTSYLYGRDSTGFEYVPIPDAGSGRGVVNTTTQSFQGVKTFLNPVTINPTNAFGVQTMLNLSDDGSGTGEGGAIRFNSFSSPDMAEINGRSTAGGGGQIDFYTRAAVLTQNATVAETGQFIVHDGSPSAPTFTFYGDLDSGLYHATTNEVDLAAGGNRIIKVTPTQAFMNVGTASVPSLAIGATDTGFSNPTASTALNLIFGGATAWIFGSSTMEGPDGSAVVPAYSFTGNPLTGVSRSGADHVIVSTGGVNRLDVSPAGVSTDGGTSFLRTYTVAYSLGSGASCTAGISAPGAPTIVNFHGICTSNMQPITADPVTNSGLSTQNTPYYSLASSTATALVICHDLGTAKSGYVTINY